MTLALIYFCLLYRFRFLLVQFPVHTQKDSSVGCHIMPAGDPVVFDGVVAPYLCLKSNPFSKRICLYNEVYIHHILAWNKDNDIFLLYAHALFLAKQNIAKF